MRRWGHAWSDRRRVINGIRWQLKTDAPWRDIPLATEDAKKHRGAEGSHREGRPPAFDSEAYKDWNVVERCFNGLQDFRAAETRYDKRSHNYLPGVSPKSILGAHHWRGNVRVTG